MNKLKEQIRKTLWKHAKPYIDEGYVIKAVNLDTKEYEVAEDLVKLYNLHFVSQQCEILIGIVKYINDYQDYLKGKEFEEVVKEYLSHINCG